MAEWTKRLQEAVEQRTGKRVVDAEYMELAEASDLERRAMQKELDLLGYYVLDYISGSPQEVKPTERRRMAQQARMVWVQDPVAGANVDLACQFIFGRGVPKPKCADDKVQEQVDEAWDDSDNQAVLTTFSAQVALCTDLVLQSNIFVLLFTGDDGKVKLGILDHDAVEDAVRDSNNRLRVLYYMARRREYGWDYDQDRVDTKAQMGQQDPRKPRVIYYQALSATDLETGEINSDDDPCPPAKLGEGLAPAGGEHRGQGGLSPLRSRRRFAGRPDDGRRQAGPAAGLDPQRERGRQDGAVRGEHTGGERDAGRADDPLADRRCHLAPALPRRPVERQPCHGGGPGASRGQEGRGLPGAFRGPLPPVHRHGDPEGRGRRDAADLADRRGARQAPGEEEQESGARRAAAGSARRSAAVGVARVDDRRAVAER